MAVISKDLGPITAYAAAVNRGYTGSREEFEILMAKYAYVGEQAAESATNAGQSAQSASQSATDAETAKGTAQQAATDAQTAQASAQGYARSAQQSAQSASQSATDAESAKQTAVNAVDGFAAGAQQALDSVNSAGNNWKSLAQAQALDSEAWALGTRDGEGVGSSDPAYNNNAKYYAQQGSASAQTATEAAQTATTKAGEAQASAEAAAESARTLTIDPTLTQSGQAADAKKTGDEITSLKEDLGDICKICKPLIYKQGTITTTGREDTANNRVRSDLFAISGKTLIAVNGQKVYVQLYQNSTWVAHGDNWESADFYLTDTDYQYRLVVAKSDISQTITPSEVTVKVYAIEDSEDYAVLLDDEFKGLSNTATTIKHKCHSYAYFTNQTMPAFVPTFNAAGALTAMTVTLPNETLYIFSADGGALYTKNLTQLPSRIFTVDMRHNLVFDMSDNSVKLVTMPTTLNSETGSYILLLSVSSSVSGLLAQFFEMSYNNATNNATRNGVTKQNIAQAYSSDRTVATIEESVGEGKVYFKVQDLYMRPLPLVNKTYNGMSDIASELNTSLVTSPNGVTNCIAIESTYTLVFSTSSNTLKVVNRNAVEFTDIVILSQVSGKVVYARPDVFPPLRGVSGLSDYINTGDIRYYSQNARMIDSVKYNSALKFLFFSDIHGAETNMKRIVSFANSLGSSKLDCIINGGDTVQSVISDGLTWYDNAVDTCDIDVLMCVGNHDEWSNASTQTPADMSAVYSAEIAPMVNKVEDIVQPTGAAENSLCYYYKDYGNIRIIVLDAMLGHISTQHYDNAQDTWFKSVLADARTNSKSVICVNHAPYAYTNPNVQMLDAGGWNCFKPFGEDGDGVYIAPGALDAVDDFIGDGGVFLCWLTGHRHKDFVVRNTQYTGQDIFVISTANHTRHTLEGATTNDVANELYDCFNYIGVDTTNKIIKVWRVGYNIDGGLKRKNTLTYDYATRSIVSWN